MANLQIDGFRILNKQRGSVIIVASFNVRLNYILLRGYEIVQLQNGKRFISVPANVYKKSDGSGYDRFNYILYEGSKGEALEAAIQTKAMEELNRRGAAVSTQQGYGNQNQGNNFFDSTPPAQQSQPLSEPDDDLPF